MALFCQLPLDLISCDGLGPYDLTQRLAFGGSVGVAGAVLSLRWWLATPRPTETTRTALLLPASTSAYFLATVLDAASRFSSRGGAVNDIKGLDRSAGAFAALSLLFSNLYLSRITTSLLSSHQHTFQTPRPSSWIRAISITLILLSLTAATLSIVSQTTISFGFATPSSAPQPIQAGFTSPSAITIYDRVTQIQLAAVLAILSTTLVAILWRGAKDAVWDDVEGVRERWITLGLWGGGATLGIVRVALVFEGLTSRRLLVRRALLLSEFVLLCGAEIIRTLQRPSSHLAIPEWRATPTPLDGSPPRAGPARWMTSPRTNNIRSSSPSRPPRSLLRPTLALDLRPRLARTSWTSATRPVPYQTSIGKADSSARSSPSTRTSSSSDTSSSLMSTTAGSNETIRPTSVYGGVGIISEAPLPSALRRGVETPFRTMPLPPTPPRTFLRPPSGASSNVTESEPFKPYLPSHPFRVLSLKSSQATLRNSKKVDFVDSTPENFREESPSPPGGSAESDDVVQVRTGGIVEVKTRFVERREGEDGDPFSVAAEEEGPVSGGARLGGASLSRSGTAASRATVTSSVDPGPFQYEWVAR